MSHGVIAYPKAKFTIFIMPVMSESSVNIYHQIVAKKLLYNYQFNTLQYHK